MDIICHTSWILCEVQDYVSKVVKDVTKVINCIHDVVLWVVTIFLSDDLVKVTIYFVTSIPTMESDRMQIFGDLCDQERLIEQVVNALLLQCRLKYLGSLVEVASLNECQAKYVVRLERVAELLRQLIKLAYYFVVNLHGSLWIVQAEHAGRQCNEAAVLLDALHNL